MKYTTTEIVNKATKYNISASAISVIILILQFCLLSFLSAPETESFNFSSINPLSFLEGVIFTLSFGLGYPVWLSILFLLLLVVFEFCVLYIICFKLLL